MPIQRINPPQLLEPEGYVHATVATGSRVVSIAGQVAYDAERTLVGPGDLAAQTEQVIRNLHTALAAAGATFDDVVDVRVFVVDWEEAKLEQFWAGAMKAGADVGAPVATSTFIPVPRLGFDGLLIEIGATAILD